MNKQRLIEQYEQFLFALHTYPEAVRFTIKHKLWEGFWRYGWVARLLIFIGLLAGLKFLDTIVKWFREPMPEDPLALMGAVGGLFQNVLSNEYNFLFTGGMKYVMLILLEIIVFHVCRGALFYLTGKSEEPTLDNFIKAQIRMIKVVVRSWVMESLIGIGISIALGFFGWLDFLKMPLIFLVQCYYMGFAVIDNYFEQFKLTIMESIELSRSYIGVVLAIGLSLQLLFLVPIIGTLLAPFFAAVTVTLVMHELTLGANSRLELVGPEKASKA